MPFYKFLQVTLKSKTFGRKNFGKTASDKNFRTIFREFQTNIIPIYKHETNVKINCNSIISIKLYALSSSHLQEHLNKEQFVRFNDLKRAVNQIKKLLP